MATGPEGVFQKRVIDTAEAYGWHVWHFRQSTFQTASGARIPDKGAAGFPDLCMCHPTIGVVFAELKAPGGKLSPKQVASISWLRGAGARVFVWRPQDWAEVVSVLSGSDVDVRLFPPSNAG